MIRSPFDTIATQALYKFCKDVPCVAKFKQRNVANQSLPDSKKFMNNMVQNKVQNTYLGFIKLQWSLLS